MIGIRGKKKLVVGNNTFYRFLVTKSNQTWYCSQRKARKCRASFRFYPSGRILPVIVEHTHQPMPFNSRIYETNISGDVYFDTDHVFEVDITSKTPNNNSILGDWRRLRENIFCFPLNSNFWHFNWYFLRIQIMYITVDTHHQFQNKDLKTILPLIHCFNSRERKMTLSFRLELI